MNRPATLADTAGLALRRRANWVQLAKFCIVGAIGLRGQPRRLRAARPLGSSLPPGGGLLLPRRGDEQLHLEPSLDVPPAARPPRLPGGSIPRRLDVALGANLAAPRRPRRPRPPEDSRPGDRDRARHAVELPREQALELPALTRRGVAGRRSRRARAGCSGGGRVPHLSGLRLGGQPRSRRRSCPRTSPAASLAEREAIQLALGNRKVADWVERYDGQKLDEGGHASTRRAASGR